MALPYFDPSCVVPGWPKRLSGARPRESASRKASKIRFRDGGTAVLTGRLFQTPSVFGTGRLTEDLIFVFHRNGYCAKC
jgi:hypothetical protein